MPTIKPRINISVSKDTNQFLKMLAKRDRVPTATRARQLLEMALEIEEDYVLGTLAEARDVKGVRYIPHDKFWKNLK